MVTSSHKVIPVMFNAVFMEHRFVCFTQSGVTLYLVVNTKTNRPKSCLKVRRELSGSQRIIAQKFVATNRTQRIIIRIFAGLKTIGVAIMRGNIVDRTIAWSEISSKSPETHEFRRNLFVLLLHSTVYTCVVLFERFWGNGL